jgi:hypothetical protein
LVLLVAAAVAAGALMFGLFRQSATAQPDKQNRKSVARAMPSVTLFDSIAPDGTGQLRMMMRCVAI